MFVSQRSPHNPILSPNANNAWESKAVFNPSVVLDNGVYHMLYRALSSPVRYANAEMNISTIGYAKSTNGIHYDGRRQLIAPEQDWERFGCEDPRITKLGDTYYIFYTALGSYPYSPESIKIGVAKTKDFKTTTERHQVTTFNSKAMALFPELINLKYVAILTAHTDLPPAKIALAFFDKEEEIWSKDYWDNWHQNIDQYILPLQRTSDDHIEVGASPVKTKQGWLILYCYIYNYLKKPSTFAIEAILTDLKNPLEIIGRTSTPLLVPEAPYELTGMINNIVFPSGALIENDSLSIYYGAADTTCCLATIPLHKLMDDLVPFGSDFKSHKRILEFVRFEENPIVEPKWKHQWEAKYTFNPAAIHQCNKIHLLYRAMGHDDVSVMGYASSIDGLHIDTRLPDPVYIPREDFEKKAQPGNSGCEDGRLTKIGDTIYMCYTAFNAKDPPRVALTTISATDFCQKNFTWTKPILISPPGMDDKDACLFPEKIQGKFVFLHRFSPNIWIDYKDDLKFENNNWIKGKIVMTPELHTWDSEKIGIGPPPIKTDKGWLLIYHGLSRYSKKYRLGAALLDLGNPEIVLSRLPFPIMEPETVQEKRGLRPDAVFSCGAVLLSDEIYLYYGAGDAVIGVATLSLSKLLEELKKHGK